MTPRQMRQHMADTTGRTFHITYVRKLMHEHGLSQMAPTLVHVNAAKQGTVRTWQCRVKDGISRLKRQGFAIVVQDESFFMHDPKTGRKYWSPKGEPIIMRYNGRHRKAAAYGAIATDGRRFFRTYRSLDAPTFLAYLKELRRHFGRVCVVMDGASPHTSRMVRNFVRGNPDIRTMYLPTATPELSAMEEYRHQPRRDVLVSEYYGTYGEMRRRLSEYLRTTPTDLDVMGYIGRKSLVLKNF